MALRIVRKAEYGPQDAPVFTASQQSAMGQMADTLIAAANGLTQAVDVAYAANDPKALEALSMKAYQQALQATETPLLSQHVEFANETLAGLKTTMSLSRTDPAAINSARKQAGNLAVQLTDEQHDMIRTLTALAVAGKYTPAQLGVAIRSHIGLHDKWAKAVENRYKKVYDGHIKNGVPATTATALAQKASAQYHERLLKKRATTIARTEVLRAENDGRFLGWKAAQDEGYLSPDAHKRWIVRPIGACEVCLALTGTVIPWNEPFGFGAQMPPRHPNCRCTAVIVDAPEGYEGPEDTALRPSGYEENGVFTGNKGGAIPSNAPAYAKPVAHGGQIDVGDIVFFDGMKGTQGYEVIGKAKDGRAIIKYPSGVTEYLNVGAKLADGKAIAIVAGTAKLAKVKFGKTSLPLPPLAEEGAIGVDTLDDISVGDKLWTSTMKTGHYTVLAVDEVAQKIHVLHSNGEKFSVGWKPEKVKYGIIPSPNKAKALLGMPTDGVAVPKASAKTAAGDKPAVKAYVPKAGDIVAVLGDTSTYTVKTVGGAKTSLLKHDGTIAVHDNANIVGLPAGAKVVHDGYVKFVADVSNGTVTFADGSTGMLSELKPSASFVPAGTTPPPPVAAPQPVANSGAPYVIETATVLGQQIAGPSGSNTAGPSGVWMGTDGKKRYVKLYKDSGQAYDELLANRLYRELGVETPLTSLAVWKDANGTERTLIVTEIVDNEGTVKTKGLTKDRADKILEGFVADVWLGNYDAVGTGLDNVVVTADGNIVRIDQGGSLFYRAQGEKKTGDLSKANPADFYTKNEYYKKVFDTAGLNPTQMAPAEMMQRLNELFPTKDALTAYMNRVLATVDAQQDALGVFVPLSGMPTPAAHADMLWGRLESLNDFYKFKPTDIPAAPPSAPPAAVPAAEPVSKPTVDPESVVGIPAGALFTMDGVMFKMSKIENGSVWATPASSTHPKFGKDIDLASSNLSLNWYIDTFVPWKPAAADVHVGTKFKSGDTMFSVEEVGPTKLTIKDLDSGNISTIGNSLWDSFNIYVFGRSPAAPTVAAPTVPFEKPPYSQLKAGDTFTSAPNSSGQVFEYVVVSVDGEWLTFAPTDGSIPNSIIPAEYWDTMAIGGYSSPSPAQAPTLLVSDVTPDVGMSYKTSDGSTATVISVFGDTAVVLANSGTVVDAPLDAFKTLASSYQVVAKPLTQPDAILPKALGWEAKKGLLTGVVDVPGVSFKIVSKYKDTATIEDAAGNKYKVPAANLTGPAVGIPYVSSSGTHLIVDKSGSIYVTISDGVKTGKTAVAAHFNLSLPSLKPAGVVPAGWKVGKAQPAGPATPAATIQQPAAPATIPLNMEVGSIVASKDFKGTTYKITSISGNTVTVETSAGKTYTMAADKILPIGVDTVLTFPVGKLQVMEVAQVGSDYKLTLSDESVVNYSDVMANIASGQVKPASVGGSASAPLMTGKYATQQAGGTQAGTGRISYGVPYSHDAGALSFETNNQGVQWGLAEFKDWRLQVQQNKTQRDAITAYSGSAYGDMNSQLRDSGSGAAYAGSATRIKSAVKALSGAIVKEDVIVNRGISSLPAKAIEAYKNLKAGDMIYDGAFQSASVGPDAAFSGPVVLRVRIPKGSQGGYLANLSRYDNAEREFLIQAGSTMRVEAVHQDVNFNGRRVQVLDVTIVAQNPLEAVPNPADIRILAGQAFKALMKALKYLTGGML